MSSRQDLTARGAVAGRVLGATGQPLDTAMVSAAAKALITSDSDKAVFYMGFLPAFLAARQRANQRRATVQFAAVRV